MMVDMDEWGQVVLLEILLRYARSQFSDPNDEVILDADHNLLLNAANPLLRHRSQAVALAAVSLLLFAGKKENMALVRSALLRLSKTRSMEHEVVLFHFMAKISQQHPVSRLCSLLSGKRSFVFKFIISVHSQICSFL
jgi:AP-3 complex subunit beta